MTYIPPSTNIKLLHGIPLDNRYAHTILFNSAAAQTSWMQSQAIATQPTAYFVRRERGVIDCEIPYAAAISSNYLMYQNVSFGAKWFYAFITEVEYISNGNSRIHFEIDVMQTWQFEYDLERCFVVRCHTATDEKYEHILPENVNTGPYVCGSYEDVKLTPLNVGMLSSRDSDGKYQSGRFVNGVYTALTYEGGLNAASLNAKIKDYVDKGQEDAIVSVFEYPAFVDGLGTGGFAERSVSVSVPSTIDGYTPKNNRLFSYPFCYISVSNNAGTSAELQPEIWNSADAVGKFKMAGASMSKPSVLLYPTQYRGYLDDYESGVSLTAFPQCAWSGDVYKVWLAQNEFAIGSNLAVGGLATAAAFLVNPVAGAAALAGLGGKALSYMQQGDRAQKTPPQAQGQAQVDSLNVAMERTGYRISFMCITKEFAESIDNYFSAYGYACNKTTLPPIHSRPCWNYVQTEGCEIRARFNAEDAAKICSIFDNGITFWHNPDRVGDYSQDNSV